MSYVVRMTCSTPDRRYGATRPISMSAVRGFFGSSAIALIP
jgi:hypothetical protein